MEDRSGAAARAEEVATAAVGSVVVAMEAAQVVDLGRERCRLDSTLHHQEFHQPECCSSSPCWRPRF